MSEAMESIYLVKLLRTPVQELLRGRVTGSYPRAVQQRLTQANLPAPVAKLISRMVKHTRLWEREQIEVVDDLIAHFLDGLEDGKTADEMILAFGDPDAASRLLRRAKVRLRPMLWHAWRATCVVAMVAQAAYIAMGIYFAVGRSNIAINYVAEVNRPLRDIPLEDRAWPIYEKAHLALVHPGSELYRRPDILDYRMEGKNWPEIAAWVQTQSKAAALTREGSRKPLFGFDLSAPITGIHIDPIITPFSPTRLVGLNRYIADSGHRLSDLGDLVELLYFEIKYAMEQKQTETLHSDLQALFDIQRQLTQSDQLLPVSYAGARYFWSALDSLDRALTLGPDLFTNEQLVGYAHRLADFRTASDLMTFRVHHLTMLDEVQHYYTDDGKGDGRITPLGYVSLCESANYDYGLPGTRGAIKRISRTVAEAGAMARVASRAELVRDAEKINGLYEAALHVPTRQSKLKEIDAECERLVNLPQYQLVGHPFISNHSDAVVYAERCLGHRDGLVVGIALELYRRDHGNYPTTLTDLVPHYLPAVPADRVTGSDVKYRLVNGHPIVYSVGDDGVDDGGKPPAKDRYDMRPDAATWGIRKSSDNKGDWILYPSASGH